MSKQLIENEYYHIYNRGAGKQKIFHDNEDYQRFMKLLYLSNSGNKFKFKDVLKHKKDIYDIPVENQIVEVGAFVLMPNHFHILIFSPFEKGGEKISLFVKKVSTGYAQYYNKKYNRTGALFEGAFKAEWVADDKYLKYLFSYIHLNPVKLIQSDWKEKGIKDLDTAVEYLNKYIYSSYSTYFLSPFEKGGRNKIVSRESFLKVFPKNFSFKKDLLEWLSYK